MTKSEEKFKAEQSAMSNEELIRLVDASISKLAKTGGRSHTMTVPPRIDDTDMILTELLKRFKSSLSELEQMKGRTASALDVNQEKSKSERFIMPEPNQLIEFDLLFADGVIDEDRMAHTLSVITIVLDRLYENGAINKPSSKE